jgi:hypothetical protein
VEWVARAVKEGFLGEADTQGLIFAHKVDRILGLLKGYEGKDREFKLN